MKLGSLFDGIGGFPLSGTKYGFEPVWASEIESFPVKVTQKHFLNMKHLGDITKINGAEIEPVDVITFGSPCQDMSVAGKRAGLKGERSGLFMEAVRIIREMREATSGQYPRFAVWENVPGAYSSNRGQDFRAVLEELSETEIPMPRSGKWANAGMVRTKRVDIAWRVLDAQYWGVPQRRKRIFLVADFRGQRAAEILFVEQGLSGDSQESGKAREEVAAGAGNGTEGTVRVAPFNTTQVTSPYNGNRVEFGLPCHSLAATDHAPAAIIAGTVSAKWAKGTGGPAGDECQNLVAFQPGNLTRQAGAPPNEKTFPTLGATTLGDQFPHVAYSLQGSMIGRADKNGPQGDGVNEDISFTLNTIDRHAVAYAVRTANTGANGHGIAEDKTHTLDQAQGQAVAQLYENHGQDSRFTGPLDVAQPVTATYGMGGNNQPFVVKPSAYTVRRLTPTECLRLQGFPDWWLDIEGASDTAKYKSIGNSVAIPCVDFVMSGIARELRRATNATTDRT